MLADFNGYMRIASLAAHAVGLRVTVEHRRVFGLVVVWRGAEAAFRTLPEFARLGPFPTERRHSARPGRLRGSLHVDDAGGGYRFELEGVHEPRTGTRSMGVAARAALADHAYVVWRKRVLGGLHDALPGGAPRQT